VRCRRRACIIEVVVFLGRLGQQSISFEEPAMKKKEQQGTQV